MRWRPARGIDDPVRTVGFDTAALGNWDSSLLVFLLQAEAFCTARSLALDTAACRSGPTACWPWRAPYRSVGRRGAASAVARGRVGNAALSYGTTRWRPSPSGRGGGQLRQAAAAQDTIAVARLLGGRAVERLRRAAHRHGLIALLVGVIIAFLGVVVLRGSAPATTCRTSSASACCARWARS
jgi:hypothetical protein